MKSIKKLICRIFGHRLVTEVYAVRCDHIFGPPVSKGKKTERLWRVFTEKVCDRCGEREIISISEPLRRSEMLKRGWFIEK